MAITAETPAEHTRKKNLDVDAFGTHPADSKIPKRTSNPFSELTRPR
jgi:hypothetical protein